MFFLLTSSVLTFHLAVVMYKCAPAPCDFTVGCHYRCIKTHFWPHSGWATSWASSQKIKVCTWLIHIKSISKKKKNWHRGLKGTASSSTATKRNPAFEQRDKDLEWEILKDLCQSKSWHQRSAKQPANKESRLSEKVTTTDREHWDCEITQ